MLFFKSFCFVPFCQGYGFITSSSNEDVFVHHSAIAGLGFKTLGEGEAVEFDIQADETGRRKAINVTGNKCFAE